MRLSKPSPALVISLIALVFAMTGTGIAAKSLITGKQIKDGSITAKDIANGAITQKKLARAAVRAKNIAPNAVTRAAIASNAVSSAAIAPNAVLGSDLGPGSVTADALAPNSVTSGALVDGSVGFQDLDLRPDPNAPVRSARALRSLRSGSSVAGTICWNGIIVYNTPCPIVFGDVTGGTEVLHFTSYQGPDKTVESDCSYAKPRWANSYGYAVGPAVDGQFFSWQASPPIGGNVGVWAQLTWSNVDRSATNFLQITLGGALNPSGNTDPGGLGDPKTYYWNDQLSIESGANSTTVVVPQVLIVIRGGEVFRVGSIACNSTASGLGYPTLTAVLAEMRDDQG